MYEHSDFMRIALKEAQKAYKKNEVPVGAVIVRDGEVVSCAHNLRETHKNALHHAEIIAIERACKKLDCWRLSGCDIYVTLEPCPMCGGAVLAARIESLFFGARDPKSGACGSVVNLFDLPKFNHRVNIVPDILSDECGVILKDFFKQLRNTVKK